MTVEFDGVTTAAYLHDETTTVAATWVANHVPAPPSPDPSRIEAGQAPIMPSGHTNLPEGRPPFEPGTLEPLWFEEGDGVAVLENGKLLAVIPGWSDARHGCPGTAGTSSARPRSAGLWTTLWRTGPTGRPGPGLLAVAGRRAVVGRLPAGSARASGAARPRWALLGRVDGQAPAGGHLRTGAGREPPVYRPVHGRDELPADARGGAARPGSRVVRPDRARDGDDHAARPAARVFLWLAPYPWRAVTWFGPGHSVRWHDAPATFPLRRLRGRAAGR